MLRHNHSAGNALVVQPHCYSFRFTFQSRPCSSWFRGVWAMLLSNRVADGSQILFLMEIINHNMGVIRIFGMNIDFYGSSELTLRYVDEETVRQQPHPTLNSYPRTHRNPINFNDVFDIDQSERQPRSKGHFFSSKKIQKQNDSRQQLTVYLQQNLGKLKARKKTVHQAPLQLLKVISNVLIPANGRELAEIFLGSTHFQFFTRVIVLVNLLAIMLIDYSFRIEEGSHLATTNIASLCLQLFCNCAFSLEIGLRLYHQPSALKDPYLIVNLAGSLATWTTIFFDMISQDDNWVYRLLVMVRIIRAVARLMEVFPSLRSPFEVFCHTIPSLQKLFFPLLIIMLFYALAGMALFAGASHMRCQSISSQGHIQYGGYCGAAAFHCPHGSTCESYDLTEIPSMQNMYGLVGFQNIGQALLTVYHFVYDINFSEIRGRYSYFVNPYICAIFFISLSVFFFYIFSNLIMISMSKAYMERVEQALPKEVAPKPNNLTQPPPTPLPIRIIKILNITIILAATVVLSLSHAGMEDQFRFKQSQLDFGLAWVSLALILILIILERSEFVKDYFNLLDVATLFIHFVDLFICLATENVNVILGGETSTLLRTVKALRVIRLLYVNDSLFPYEKYVIRVFLRTLYKVRSFMLLCLCFVLMFKELGELLFAYEVRTAYGQPYINNFEGFWSSLFTTLYFFFNEQWATTMYHFYSAVGLEAIAFFTVISFIAHLMVMRLYIAVFLSYFKQQLHKNTTKNPLKQTSHSSDVSQDDCQPRESPESPQPVIPPAPLEQRSCPMAILSSLYNSRKFQIFLNGVIIMHAISIIIRSAEDAEAKTTVLKIVENVCLGWELAQVVAGCLLHGIYFCEGAYLHKSRSNVIGFLGAGLMIASWLPLGSDSVVGFLRRAAVIRIFTLFRETDKEMAIILDTIFQMSKKFVNFVLIYIFFLLVVSLPPLRLLADSPLLGTCTTAHVSHEKYANSEACLAAGGTWDISIQGFRNIFGAIGLMYELVSSQGWTPAVQGLWAGHHGGGWQFYFLFVFFIYNICFLGIFMGFIVETYLHLKDQAYNLNLLRRSQRGWVLIRNSIHCLLPEPVLRLPNKASPAHALVFRFVNAQIYTLAFDCLAYFNVGLLIVGNIQGFYGQILDFFRSSVIGLFLLDTVLKIFALRSDYIRLSNALPEISGAVYAGGLFVVNTFVTFSPETTRICKCLLVVLNLLRCKNLLTRISWCKTHLNSVIDILPKCGKIIKLVCAFLFFYAALGMQLFAGAGNSEVVDHYNIGFNDFLTAALTLVRVCVSESWYVVVSGFASDWQSFPYFLTFHVVMVLLILNLLIATMASAYDDNYEIEYNSVNIFQLQDCLSLWQKYDPSGSGVVHYKKFWRLTSEIAILFGISKKKLIKRKNKFFEELDLQIYRQPGTGELCYRFHDVIAKFSKIKLQIANLASDLRSLHPQIDIEFDISPSVLREIKDYVTPFPDNLYADYRPFRHYKSGQTKYIFGLLKKLRQWKHVATEKKRIVGGTKLSSIFDLKSRKMDQQPHSLADLDFPA